MVYKPRPHNKQYPTTKLHQSQNMGGLSIYAFVFHEGPAQKPEAAKKIVQFTTYFDICSDWLRVRVRAGLIGLGL